MKIHLNYTNLDAETQEELMRKSKKEVTEKFGDQIKMYAQENQLLYADIIEKEAIKHLYKYTYTFSV